MRINIIPPKELYDQHLMAEIREIKMLPKALVRSINSKQGIDFKNLPKQFPTYTLNKGHGKFFYNKLGFIERRFQELLNEANLRGFTLQQKTKELYDSEYNYSSLMAYKDNPFINIYQDYFPSKVEQEINKERIELRRQEKIGFYKYYGKSVDCVDTKATFKGKVDKINHQETESKYDVRAKMTQQEYLDEIN